MPTTTAKHFVPTIRLAHQDHAKAAPNVSSLVVPELPKKYNLSLTSLIWAVSTSTDGMNWWAEIPCSLTLAADHFSATVTALKAILKTLGAMVIPFPPADVVLVTGSFGLRMVVKCVHLVSYGNPKASTVTKR